MWLESWQDCSFIRNPCEIFWYKGIFEDHIVVTGKGPENAVGSWWRKAQDTQCTKSLQNVWYFLFNFFADWLSVLTSLCPDTQKVKNKHTENPKAIWQHASTTLSACSFTNCLGQRTGPWHRESARPPWLPASHHPSISSSPPASNKQSGSMWLYLLP